MSDKPTLTEWSKPDEVINSGYGSISYQEWCEKERDRINTRGDGVRIVTHEDGCIALSR